MTSALMKFGLDALYFSGAGAVLSPFCQGAGVIFTLHHVRPARPGKFQPNSMLEVTPEFLEHVVIEVRRQGFDIVSLDEAHRRIVSPGNDRPFASFTFDDGYRDNRDHAYPVFAKHHCPFTVFVTTSFSDGTGELWWVALEEMIRAADRIAVPEIGMGELSAATNDEKTDAFWALYYPLRGLNEHKQRDVIRAMAQRQGLDLAALCKSLVMSWSELKAFANEPWVSIGAHTVHHFAVARLGEKEAREEIERGADIIGKKLGRRPSHLAYPYGDPASAGARDFALAADAGFKTALTTRKGVVFNEHRDHLMALPRVSLNGNFQSLRYVNMFLKGTPFLLWNGFRRLDVA